MEEDLPDLIGFDNDVEDSTHEVDVEEELHCFRQQWKNEIKSQNELKATRTKSQGNRASSKDDNGEELPSKEEQAKYLFLQGVNAEKDGRLSDAVQYYRRAVQLVPDIEFRIEELRTTYKERTRNESLSSYGSDPAETEDEADVTEETDLLTRFQNVFHLGTPKLCQPASPQQMTHISSLPVELLMLIFRWVVSAHLDTLSLQALSQVCRGFYMCVKDDELWKTICIKTWGMNCGRPGQYGSYRDMFSLRPRILYHGLYISKMTYYRPGEKSLDNFYRPVHLVEYYRYVRFLPDGHILMLTSPTEPRALVSFLRTRHCDVQGLLIGYYKIADNQITAVLKRLKTHDYNHIYRYKKRGRNQNTEEPEQNFHVEFSLHNTRGEKFTQLTWNHYSVHTVHRSSNAENIAEFDLNHRSYPPLIFSRVRSYTSNSECILK